MITDVWRTLFKRLGAMGPRMRIALHLNCVTVAVMTQHPRRQDGAVRRQPPAAGHGRIPLRIWKCTTMRCLSANVHM